MIPLLVFKGGLLLTLPRLLLALSGLRLILSKLWLILSKLRLILSRLRLILRGLRLNRLSKLLLPSFHQPSESLSGVAGKGIPRRG